MSYVVRRQEITARALSMSTPDAELAAVWDEDPWLAIDMAEVINHVSTLERAFTSGAVDLQLRVVASSSLPHLNPALLTGDLPVDVRRVLLLRLKKGRHRATADALIEHVFQTAGDHEAASLLPGCSREMVEQWLPRLRHLASPALARQHPDLMLDLAFAELPALDSQARDNWWRHNVLLVDEAIDHEPARVLELISQFGPSTWMPVSAAKSGRLAEVDAGRFLRAMHKRAYRPLSKAAYLILAKANPPELVQLGRIELFPVLRAFPPSQRVAFFDAVHADKNMSHVDLDDAVLRLLPRSRRAAETRRMRANALAAGEELQARRLAQFLPYDEARETLTELTYAGEATERAEGYPLLIACAARNFRLAELLPWLADRLKREQDPVRMAAFQALAAASPRAFGEAPELAQIAADAFDARDLSSASSEALAALCVKLLVDAGSELALSILGDMWHRDSWISLGRLDRRLRHGQEHAVYRAFAKTITENASLTIYQPALALVTALGKRAWQMPELMDTLWGAIKDSHEGEARDAIRLLLDDPRTRNERVQRIVEIDPSTVFIPEVLRVLQFRRTDLLDVLFGDELPQGRFAPGEVRRVPLGLQGTRRWLPAQRLRYAVLLGALADNPAQDRGVQAAAVRTLGTIHGQDALAYLDSEDELVAQAAIAVLPDLPDPVAALRLLLDRALSDNRGQAELASMYTIRRCARRVAPSALAGILLQVQGGRVTVRKELVRLISDFRLPDAVGLLHRAWHAENQHRDVRAAIAFAALSWLDEPAAWDLLRAAVSGPREVAMQVLRVSAYTVPERHRPEIARLISEVATGQDTRLKAQALQQLGTWLTWFPAAIPVLVTSITDLDDRTGWAAAAVGLISAITTPAAETAVLDCVEALATATATDPDADADRDRPGLQRTRVLIDGLTHSPNSKPPRRGAIVRLTEALASYPEIRREVIELRLSTVRTDTTEASGDIQAVALLMADRPVLAAQVSRHAWTDWSTYPYYWNRDAMLDAARNVGNGYLATSILAVGGPHFGWPEDWRSALRELRRHADPDVRDAALRAMTSSEDYRTMLTSRPGTTITLRGSPPSSSATIFSSASAAAFTSSVGGVGRHGDPGPDLAVDLDRVLDRVLDQVLLVDHRERARAPANPRGPAAATAPRRCAGHSGASISTSGSASCTRCDSAAP